MGRVGRKGRVGRSSSDLDQYYTRPEVARRCVDRLNELLALTGEPAQTGELAQMGAPPGFFFVEPSAGAGAFYDCLPAGRRLGLDICPPAERSDILCQDFLEWEPAGLGKPAGLGNLAPPPQIAPPSPDKVVVVGNPPFGSRGRTAVAFFCAAARFAATIAFVLPVSFRKFHIHKQLPDDYRWVSSLDLPADAFELPDKSNYRVNAEFQIWSTLDAFTDDHRLRQPPAISHRDFELRQYNNTAQALKVFDQEFDFAVPCQGYQDYTRRETDSTSCEKHKQWMLFKANNPRALAVLREMDFEELAFKVATVTPGFRKNDVVAQYQNHVSR